MTLGFLLFTILMSCPEIGLQKKKEKPMTTRTKPTFI